MEFKEVVLKILILTLYILAQYKVIMTLFKIADKLTKKEVK